MADIVTHATFALEVVKNIKDIKLRKILNRYRDCYLLGSQGPDIFFFHRFLTYNKKFTYKRLGNQMHEEKTKAFLMESIKYLKNNYSEKLHSYLCGFLSHHALDRNVHPYIYHVSGASDIKYRGNHLRIERAIDSWFIINIWKEEKPHLFYIHKRILNFNINKKLFIPYYNYILHKVYNKDNGGKIFIKSTNNFRKYIKFIYDRWGIKKKLAIFLDKFNRSKIVFETLFYYKNINKDIDYLNLNKKEWQHPVLKNKLSNESFLDLYDKVKIEVTEEIRQINLYLNNKIDYEVIDNVIKSTSYATGLLCDENNTMTNFNVIF